MESITQGEEEFEDETIWERIQALDEMLPESVMTGISTTRSGIESIFRMSKAATWFVASTAAILILPLSVELERQEYLEQMKRQEKDILFGSES